MTHEVITVTEEMVLEEAGRIMVDRKASGLPVLRGDEASGVQNIPMDVLVEAITPLVTFICDVREI